MSKEEIYEALQSSWWLQQPSLWNTAYLSTVILFDTEAITNCEYVSSAPIQTSGLNSGPDAPQSELNATIDNLREKAAQQLFDMHCTSVTGHKDLEYVYNATS